MKILAIILGAVLIDVAVRGSYENSSSNATDGKGLWPLLKNDFEPGNKGNFLAWFAAIMVIGMIGYIPELKPIANMMLALLIVVLLLAAGNAKTGTGGFFAMLEQAVQTPAPTATAAAGGL